MPVTYLLVNIIAPSIASVPVRFFVNAITENGVLPDVAVSIPSSRSLLFCAPNPLYISVFEEVENKKVDPVIVESPDTLNEPTLI